MKLSDTLILGLAVVARAAIPTAATTSNSEEICSVCSNIDSFVPCSSAWFLILEACAALPCGISYSTNPAATCTISGGFILPSGFKEMPARTIDQSAGGPCTLCGNLDSFLVCSPSWYLAVEACAAPPCNGVYDPVARGCSNNAYIYPTISTGGIAKQLKNGYGRAEEAYTPSPAVPTYDSQATDIASAIGAIPSCATSCMFSSIAADGCEIADFKCHCSSGAKIRPQLAPCIAKACSSSDEDAFYAQVESFCQEVYSNSGDVSSSVITSTSIPSATTVLPTKPASTETTSSGYITVSEILISVDSTPTPVGGNITTLIANTTTIAADTGSLSGDITSTAISNASAKTTKSSVSRSTSTEKSSTTNTSKALAAIATAKSYLTHGVVAAIGGVLLVI